MNGKRNTNNLVRTVSIEDQVRSEFECDKTLAYRFAVVSKTLFGKRMIGMPQEFFVGRDYQNDLSIHEDRCVSRRHFSIRLSGSDYLIHDLATRNGTFVNNDRIYSEITLRSGDVIRCGNSYYKFIVDVDMGALLILVSPELFDPVDVDAPTRSVPALFGSKRKNTFAN